MTYSELANLDVIDASGLFLLAGPEPKGRNEFADEVESTEDDAGADKGVGAACEGVGKLVAKLDPVAVEPATGDDGVAVEMRYVVTRG